jgi:hypothetical protein
MIIHEDIAANDGKIIKKQEPDAVIGLRFTETLDQLVSSRRSRYSPFKDTHVVYPFIVIEVKSDESADGFGSIERQSAFAIRTCLKLQQNIKNETSSQHQCIVWFFAMKGDMCWLYGAIPEGYKTVSVIIKGVLFSDEC